MSGERSETPRGRNGPWLVSAAVHRACDLKRLNENPGLLPGSSTDTCLSCTFLSIVYPGGYFKSV